MTEFFASGRAVDVVLFVVVLEALALAYAHRRGWSGLPPGTVLIALLPGVALMLALRAALTDAWWGWIALCLTAALAAHVADLRRRLSR